MKTQLLCTFSSFENFKKDIHTIIDNYSLVYDYLYILQNKKELSELYITYNVNNGLYSTIPNTISVHRKKETNTIYSINALNSIIRELNHGMNDNDFELDWVKYKNTILLTRNKEVVKIETKIFDIVKI